MGNFDALSKREPRMTDKQRIQAAAKLGAKLEPVGTSETVLIGIGFTLYGLMAIAIALAWLNKDYKPIKAKNVLNVTLVFAAGVWWTIGVLPSYGIVNVVGVWAAYKFWSIWVKISGVFMYVFLVVLRTHALHRIFIQKRPLGGLGYYWPTIIFVVFLLTFQITSTAIPTEMSVGYTPSLELYAYSKPFHITCVAIACLLWLIHTIYIFLTRNIRSCFNEFRESLIIYLIGMANVIEALLMYHLVPFFPLYKKTRLAISSCVIVCVCTPVLVLLMHPLYMCYFDHDGYLTRWRRKLVRDSMIEVYKLQGIEVSMETLTDSMVEKGVADEAQSEVTFGNGLTENGIAYAGSTSISDGYVPRAPFQNRDESGPEENRGNDNMPSNEYNRSEGKSSDSFPSLRTLSI